MLSPSYVRTALRGVKMSIVGIIAGMHRSGTSALARMMNLYGFEIPGELDTNTHHNATGHWEPVAFVSLNTHILKELGADWCALRLPETSTLDGLSTKTRAALTAYATESFSLHDTIVIKDPRVCYTLPLWLDEVTQRGDTALVLLPYRHPLEVAKSLAARDEMHLNVGLALWLCSMLSAEYYSRGQLRSAIEFGAFIDNWRIAFTPVAERIGTHIPEANDPIGTKIDQYINREQRHQTVQQLTDEHRALSMLDLALEAYETFHSDLDTPAVREHLDALRHRVGLHIAAEGLAEAAREFGLRYSHMRAIAERDDLIVTLRKKITELEGTIAWREGHLDASIAECDWRRTTTSALQAEVQRLSAVVNTQDTLIGPFRWLIGLWLRITRRNTDTPPSHN